VGRTAQDGHRTAAQREDNTMTAASERLNAAAGLLLGVARASSAAPGAQLHCLAAVDLLHTAGADPRRPKRPGTSVSSATFGSAASATSTTPTTPTTAMLAVAIRSGCSQLAGLPPDVFALTPVADAAAHARRALELLGGA
jgi:hypothetical protein